MKRLETDAEVASLRAREEGLKLEIVRLTERYVQDRLALGMLEHARARHERENQPRLLAEASAVFARITAGRYGRVIARAEGGLEVEDRSGKVRPAAELSRGTREQLYLSFRIALIRDFAGTKGPLPVIVDDILVNFDPDRARATVRGVRGARADPSGHRVLLPAAPARGVRRAGRGGAPDPAGGADAAADGLSGLALARPGRLLGGRHFLWRAREPIRRRRDPGRCIARFVGPADALPAGSGGLREGESFPAAQRFASRFRRT